MKSLLKRLPWSNNSIVETISAVFVFLFLYTAFSKLHEQESFVMVLGKSPLLGSFRHVLGWGIPLTEIALSIMLTIPKTRRRGLFGSLLLMSLFTLYLIYMVIFTPELPCSCGGVLKQMTWTQHIFFNLFFVALAGLGLLLTSKKSDMNNPPSESEGPNPTTQLTNT